MPTEKKKKNGEGDNIWSACATQYGRKLATCDYINLKENETQNSVPYSHWPRINYVSGWRLLNWVWQIQDTFITAETCTGQSLGDKEDFFSGFQEWHSFLHTT